MRRTPGPPLWLISMTVVLAGCSLHSAAPPQSAPPPPSPPQISGGPALPSPGSRAAGQVVNMTLRDFAIEPQTIEVHPGRVTFQIANQGAVEHDFHIPAVEQHAVHAQHLVKPGETRLLEYDLRRGTYEVICTIPGHREAGMIATVHVGP